MRIGVVGGTGPAGTGLGLRLASVGFDVDLGSREAGRAADVVEGLIADHPDWSLSLTGCSNVEAAGAEVVVMATPWDASAPTAKKLADQLEDKLVICIANALAKVGSDFFALYPPRGSVAADVQAMVPDARVVAAFQHLPARQLAAIDTPLVGDVLVCADRLDALDQTIALIEHLPDLRGLDCGSLANAGPVEAFTAVLLRLNRRYHAATSVKIAGL